MRSSKPIVFILLLAATAAFFFWLFRTRPSGSAQPESKSPELSFAPNKPSSSSTHQSASTPGSPTSTPSSPSAPGQVPPFANTSPPNPETPYILGSPAMPPSMEPATLLNNMRNVIANYRSRYGGNPVGLNEEITAALNGGNTNGAKFITEESGLRINGRGQLVDSWGTPFFFHQLSADIMEIRSAGPDRQMYTPDDLVTK